MSGFSEIIPWFGEDGSGVTWLLWLVPIPLLILLIAQWWRRGNRATDPIVGRVVTWLIGAILIPLALLFLLLLLQLWPPPKPQEGFTLAFKQDALAVYPGDPATYTILVRGHSGFSGLVTLQAVVLPDKQPDNLTYAFAPPGATPTTGLLAPSPTGSSAVLTLQTQPGEEDKNYSIMVAAISGGQTQTIAGRLLVSQKPQEVQSAEAQQQDTSEERALYEGFSELTLGFFSFSMKMPVADEVRLFLIVAVVGCLGGLLHSIRSWVWYAGHARLERSWIPLYASTPIVGMAMALLFYLLFRAGFISPATPAAETNTFGFAAIAGLVGLFSNRASKMLENVADILFSKAESGGGTVSPGDFDLTVSNPSQTVAPGNTATYSITVSATQDFSESVRLTFGIDPSSEKGPSVNLNPALLKPTTTGVPVTLIAATAADTPPSPYKITVRATGGGKEHMVEVLLTVTN